MKYAILILALAFCSVCPAKPAAKPRKPSSSGQQHREDLRHFAAKHGLTELDIQDCPLTEPVENFIAVSYFYSKKSKKVFRVTDRDFESSTGGPEADRVSATDLSSCSKVNLAL